MKQFFILFLLIYPQISEIDNIEKKAKEFLQNQKEYYKLLDLKRERTKRIHNKPDSNVVFVIDTLLKANKSFINHYEQTVYQRIEIIIKQYNSSSNCQLAINNYLESARLKKWKNQGFKTTPFVYIFNDFSTYYCRTACEHIDKKWEDFKNNFIESFANKESVIIVGYVGKIEWTTKEKYLNRP